MHSIKNKFSIAFYKGAISIILLLFQSFTIAQINNIFLLEKLNDSAEICLAENRINDAIFYYEKCIKIDTLDININLNLILCYNIIGNPERSTGIMKRVVINGFPLTYFKKEKYKILTQRRDWIEFEKKYYFETRIKKPNYLALFIDSLLIIDQEIRKNDIGQDSSVIVQKNLAAIVEGLLMKYGYLSYRQLGFVLENDTILSSSPFTYLLIHSIQVDRVKFKTILDSLRSEGKFSKYDYLWFSRYFENISECKLGCEPFLNSVFIQVNNKIYTCCNKNRIQVNYRRSAVGLIPLEQAMQIIEFYYSAGKKFSLMNAVNSKIYVKNESDLPNTGINILKDLCLYKELYDNDSYFK